MAPKKKPYNKLSKSAKYYRDNPGARKRKKKTDTKINKRKRQVKKRTQSNRARRAAKRKGRDLKGKDYDHSTGRFVKSSTNRGRAGEGGRKRGSNKNKGPRKRK